MHHGFVLEFCAHICALSVNGLGNAIGLKVVKLELISHLVGCLDVNLQRMLFLECSRHWHGLASLVTCLVGFRSAYGYLATGFSRKGGTHTLLHFFERVGSSLSLSGYVRWLAGHIGTILDQILVLVDVS